MKKKKIENKKSRCICVFFFKIYFITKGITIIIIHVTNSNGTSRIGITKGQAPVLNPSSTEKEQQQMAGIAGGGG